MFRPSVLRWRRVPVRPRRAPTGFAIVATLSLVIVMLILAIGLLSLSSITMRAGNREASRAIARANARMALVIAVGELQKLAGPDTRITATADTIDPPAGGASSAEVRPTGVWRSWENLNQNAGKPVTPHYEVKLDPGKSGTAGADGGRFLGWLVSHGTPTQDPLNPPTLTDGTGKVTLLGKKSVGDSGGPNREVHLTPVTTDDGAYAWWIGGENAKANIGRLEPKQQTTLDWKDSLASNSPADPEIVNITMAGDKYEVVPKLASRGTLDPATGSQDARRDHFHSITTYSRGLLTNAATGGWKKDLSLLAETYPSSTSAPSKQTLLYPWAALRNGGSDPFAQVGPITSWGALVDYVTQYKQILSGSSAGRVTMNPAFGSILNSSLNEAFLNKVSKVPVVASAQLVLAHSAMTDVADKDKLDAALTVNPVLTLWNPWSVEISVPSLTYLLRKSPLSFHYTLNNVPQKAFNLSDLNVTLSMSIDQAFVLKPGETRVFSPASGALVDYTNHPKMSLTPGYRTRGGYQVRIVPLITGKSEDRLSVEMAVNDVVSATDAAEPYSGAFIDINYGSGSAANSVWAVAHRMVFKPAIASKYYQNLTGLPTATLGQVVGANNEVFATCSMGNRCANDSKFPSRGFDGNNPLTLYSELGLQGSLNPGAPNSASYRGSQHPVNSPMDLNYKAVTGWNDTNLPAADSSNEGYILTSTAADKGMKRCVAAEMPVRPLRSLGELQHFQARGQNPYPPFKIDIIGNSFATPLAASDSAFITIGSANSKMQYDDSYCMNQLLFDAYFFSSIAPETNDWTKTTRRSLDDVYGDMLNGITPLPNRAYVASRGAVSPSVGEAISRDLSGNRNKAWLTIASRLEVDGMFNINSTSVDAWKSLLAHARNTSVPEMQVPSTGSWSVSTGQTKDHPVSRTTVAGAGCADGSDGLTGYSRFGGYRDLTDDQITALAEGIVQQIHKRGPALSYAEFVNRQLQSGSQADLALSGVIQSALDQMAQSATNNPYSELEGLCEKIASDRLPGPEAEYAFTKAALGWTGEGLPGWFTQADILRPLAPVLSVRDDTFVIRTYGESRDKDGNTEARAWCEAVVARHGDYIQPGSGMDAASDDNLTKGSGKDLNTTFGRSFAIVSFRFLNSEEV